MTFLQRKGGTKGIKQEVKGGKQHSSVCSGWMEFGTNSVQLRERKNGFLVPKRHWMKHLDFLSFWLESRQSMRNPNKRRKGRWVRSRMVKILVVPAAPRMNFTSIAGS